ncbi:hypothetical protein PV08_04959 [Exophiala spinifera]|uniref:Uncharacterized protein n=1 Tax=Exophiala spinifera TaxID=91928 RepID=A0A0D2C277_9EURO|nr:uncharacterized protein PV08_04959 [Exophiala spinifera]KIW17764.1 hypothetical protein PV08_04959 [Exophiala spinifera]
MSANSGNGGVRNLRAMFENKATDQASSPPSRGRSPNPSEFSNGSRPVSKVRASFVAVERPGENGSAPILGLRRTSDLSNRDENKENSSIAALSPERRPLAREMSSFDGSRKEGQYPNGSTQGGLGDILKGSAFADNGLPKDKSDNRDATKLVSGPQTIKKSVEASSQPKDATKTTGLGSGAQSNGKMSGSAPKNVQPAKPTQSTKPPPVKQIVTKPPPSTKSNPASQSPLTSKPSPKTPTSPIAHIRGGPAKIKGVMESAKRAQEAREAAEQKSAKTSKPQSTVPAARSNLQAKQSSQPIKKDPASTSPKVPKSPRTMRPKSPTRPARLPAAATAPTAASAAKHDAQHSPTETAPRKSITKRASTTSMKPPRASMPSSTGPGILAKKTSRASLANGHGHGHGHERPTSRVSTSRADDGFLARMMRPTASSAQKVHDKVQVNSPPRSKAASSHKHKDASKQKIPTPKMHREVAEHGAGETKDDAPVEEEHSHEVAGHSTLQVVEEDTQPSNAEAAATKPDDEPTETEAVPPAAEPISDEANSDLPISLEPSSSDAPGPISEEIPTAPDEVNEVEPEKTALIDATETKSTIASEDAEAKSDTPVGEIEPKTAVPTESVEPTTSTPADVPESVTAATSAATEPADKDSGDV